MLKIIEEIYENDLWKENATRLLNAKTINQEVQNRFHIMWTTKGHRIREQIGDDELLSEIIWKLLPKYKCGDMILYRGENLSRLDDNELGFCWTDSLEIAEMFARGLNSVFSGGVLIKCLVKADWIISGISNHSKNLGVLSGVSTDPPRQVNCTTLSPERLLPYR